MRIGGRYSRGDFKAQSTDSPSTPGADDCLQAIPADGADRPVSAWAIFSGATGAMSYAVPVARLDPARRGQ